MIQQEIKFTTKFIKLSPTNESSWNYLRGCYNHNGNLKITDFPEIYDLCVELNVKKIIYYNIQNIHFYHLRVL